MNIGILTGDPELGNVIPKVSKREYMKLDKMRIDDAVVNYVTYKGKQYKFIKITPNMINDDLFKTGYIDFLFYNFYDPVAAKIKSERSYKAISQLLKRFPNKVYPPPKFGKWIEDKCVYYSTLQEKEIPIVPFFCVDKKTYEKTTDKDLFVRETYQKIIDLKWKGVIGKPILGTSGRGLSIYPDLNKTSKYEIYKQIKQQFDKVFYDFKFPKLLFQEKHKEFGSGKRPEIKMYYIGTRFIYGFTTYQNTYYEIGKGPINTKYFMSKQNIRDVKSFARRVLNVVKPFFNNYPLLLTRIDIGCCLDHTSNGFHKKNFFLNEIEYAPAFITSELRGKTKKFLDIKLGNQIINIVNHHTKKNS